MVVKYGGNALAGTSDHDALDLFAQDIVLMRLVGIRPVVVHGGGPQISALMARLGKTTEFRDGLRVTDAETVDIARMVLIGQVNPQLVTAINLHGNYAVGVSGEDAGLIKASARNPELGFVGDIDAINPGLLEGLLADEFIPVVATIGTDDQGQAYNINADVVAGAIAEALGRREADLPHRHRGPPPRRRRPGQPDPPDHGRRARRADGRRHDRRRDDPQGRRAASRPCATASAGPTSSTAASPTSCSSSCSPTPASAPWSTATPRSTTTRSPAPTGGSAMTAHAFATDGLTECPFMPVFGPPQIMFVKGRGTELWDSDGKRYLDFLGGLAVIGLGHANPVVAAAIAEQAGELLHVSNLFANPVATKAAIEIDRLLAEATGYAGQVFFTNSGAEANECALKLARKHGGRGRHVVVSALGSFHGRTLATLAATGQPTKHEPFQPMPEGFHHVAWGDVDAIAKAVDATVAAVLIEPVQGEGGVNQAPDGYLAAIREICDQTGALMMLDEIQSGFGRTGRWFGFAARPYSDVVVKRAGRSGPSR